MHKKKVVKAKEVKEVKVKHKVEPKKPKKIVLKAKPVETLEEVFKKKEPVETLNAYGETEEEAEAKQAIAEALMSNISKEMHVETIRKLRAVVERNASLTPNGKEEIERIAKELETFI